MAIRKEVEKEGYVKWLNELTKDSVGQVGGKGANLAEMYNNKMPVPPAFVITAATYKEFLEVTGINKEIYERLSRVDIEKTVELEEAAKKIRELIESKEIPKEMREEILESYGHLDVDEESLRGASADALGILKRGREPPFVAVRSSATSEDSAEASFAGQQATFLNVKGNEDLIKAVRGCWASLFSARSVYYRIKKGFKHEETAIAVVVQKMVNPEKSGVIFTKDPRGLSEDVIIEAVYGLGEGIVSGMIAPDHYVINRNLEVQTTKVSDKKVAIVRTSSGTNEKVNLTTERSNSQVLTSYEIKKLTQYALEVENHYNKPQDLEFAIDSHDIYIVQTRPITTIGKKPMEESSEELAAVKDAKVIIEGLAASPGVASGVVKIIHDLSELNRIIKGDVLVTEMTNPDMVVAMQKAAAIVTDEGGLTSHAAIVSREMGIPAVVGTRTATTTLKEGQTITVDGFTGKVYEGVLEGKKVEIKPIVKGTKTKIKVILDLPKYADRAALTEIEAVGLTRVEGIIAEGGKHPNYYLNEGKIDEYEEVIYQGIKKIAEKFKEVWVRTSDLRSDEYRNLEGAPKEIEANPMLGMHGIRAGLKDRGIILAEVKALKRVADEGKIMGVLTPQVISVEEVKELAKVIEEAGAGNNENIKMGVMVETPAAVQIIEELCDEGIKFISFGTNDLTQYTLAIDRGNEAVQGLYNEKHPAVLRQIEKVIKACKEKGVESSICGQAGSDEEMVRHLVSYGIDSISVNADKAYEISLLVKELEEKSENKNTINDKENKELNEETSEEKEELVEDNYEEETVEELEAREVSPRTPQEKQEKKEADEDEDYEKEILKELNDKDNTEEAGSPEEPAHEGREILLDIF